jgi:Fe-S-cluster containining protein
MELDQALANYLALRARIDIFAARITNEFAPVVACRAGCDSCCRHLTISPVEAYAMAAALQTVHDEEQEDIRARARAASPDACPLLTNGRCLLYAARPLICRTHGLPLLIVTDEMKRVDYCPSNFQGVDRLPGWAILDLEQLNTALAAINALYVREVLRGDAPERISLGEALLLKKL